MSLLKWMGVGQAEPAPPPAVAIPGEQTPSDAASKMFGMENFGNTCYANSVLQALYFCQPFRDLVCVTPDGRPLPEIPIASLPAQVALPSPPPKDPVPPTPGAAPPTATPKPVQPGMGGPKLSFKRQNSTAPLSLSAVPGTPTDPSPALALSPGATAEPAADAQQVMRSIESLHRLPPSIFSALRALFLHISLNTQEKGMVSPSAFIAALKKENVDFRTSQHQDAHEFLNYLLNRVAEDIDENRTRWEDIERKEKERLALNGGAYKGNGHSLANGNAAPVPGVEDGGSLAHASTDSSGPPTYTSATPASSPPATPPRVGPRPLPSNRPTLIQSLFEGQLTNETRCLSCNTVSHRDETFLDLSIDIEPNSSVTACLREFSKGEMLLEDNRFRCDHCNEYCDAEKRMKVKTLPNILALHLKRFKYIEDANRNIRPTKLTYRVAFPLELRLFDTSDDAQNPDRLYELFAIVVHIGAGLAHGHYVTVVRTQGKWVLFDDDTVDVIKESDIMKYFGDAPGGQGYVLFYQAVDIDVHALGLPDRLHQDNAPRTTIPPPAFPPEWSSDKQFADHGLVYTPYAGTSQAQAAASLVPLPSPTPAPPTPTPAQGGKKGLKLDIPATPKFDPSTTLNSLRSLAGPLTMPTPGNREQNGGFFSRTLRHSQSKIDKQSTPAGGMMTSPITAAPPPGQGLPPMTAAPGLKARPSSRGKDAASWLANRIGKEKKREGEDSTPSATPTPLLRAEDSTPPVPALPPLPMSPINGPDSPGALIGLGISDQRRPSLPGSLERVQETAPPRTPEPAEELAPMQQSPGFFTPLQSLAAPSAHTSGMLSPPLSPIPVMATPISPSSRASSNMPIAVISQSPTEDTPLRSQSVEPKPRPAMHRKRPSTAGGKLSNGPLSLRPMEETNGVEKRGRRMSRDDSHEKSGEKKWYQRIGKKDRPSTAGGKSEEDDEYAVVSDVIDITGAPDVPPSFEPPVRRHHYVPPPALSNATSDTTDPDASIDNSSTTSSDERADRTGPLPVPPSMSSSLPLPPTAFMSAPASPNRSFGDTKAVEPPKPKRKLSMNKPSLRLSWFGSSNNLKDAAGGAETTSNPPVTPTESKKSRIPLGR